MKRISLYYLAAATVGVGVVLTIIGMVIDPPARRTAEVVR